MTATDAAKFFTALFRRGETTKAQTVELKQRLLAGLHVQEALDAIEAVPYVHGVPETVDELRNRGLCQVIFSDSLELIARHQAHRLGIPTGLGVPMEVQPGRLHAMAHLGVSPDSVLSGEADLSFSKAEALKGFLSSMGLTLGSAAVIDDSAANIPVMSEALASGGLAIAFNALPKDRANFASAGIPSSLDLQVVRDAVLAWSAGG